MEIVEENTVAPGEIWYSFYAMPKSFVDRVVSRFGKNDLFFRDVYNYRNLKKNEMFRSLGLSCPLHEVYLDFPKRVVDKYVSAIGNEKFQKCLGSKSMDIETIFDEKDCFVDCKDFQDFWKCENSVFPEMDGSHYFDFEKYLMEDIEDMSLSRGEMFYVLREKRKILT